MAHEILELAREFQAPTELHNIAIVPRDGSHIERRKEGDRCVSHASRTSQGEFEGFFSLIGKICGVGTGNQHRVASTQYSAHTCKRFHFTR